MTYTSALLVKELLMTKFSATKEEIPDWLQGFGVNGITETIFLTNAVILLRQTGLFRLCRFIQRKSTADDFSASLFEEAISRKIERHLEECVVCRVSYQTKNFI